MKKMLSICAAIIMGLCLFCGCKEEEKAEPIAGKFYSLEEAYESEWLTKEDLMSIAYYLNNGRQGNEEIMSEDYAPIPKTPETLSEEVTAAIKQEFWDANFNELNSNGVTVDDIGFAYYGSYGKCVAVRVNCSEIALGVYYELDYFGVLFQFTSWSPIANRLVEVWILN